uniref:Uncharacterized protein n=1 Tax=Nelumbo nucifera TaxID=4432 RepID=A0A822ZDN0_NELNU|nr:TPA_asm: hypothetical protein HUJ06_015447 [Nelumbo nucifera]DAD41126.1 TPA_asm: hypothetical protein HUJ06_015449 [Nelumbo nucifera]
MQSLRRNAAMIERLSNLHQSRLQQSISRKSDSTLSPFEVASRKQNDLFRTNLSAAARSLILI